MTLKTKTLLLVVAIVLLTSFFGGLFIGHKRADHASEATQNALNQEIQRYIVEIDKKTLYIAEKDQEIKTLRQAKQAGDVTNEELRKLNVKYVHELTRLKVMVDTMLNNFPHNGQIIFVHDTITIDKKALLLPFTFSKRDQWMTLAGTFNIDAKLDITLKLNTSLDIWAVQKKKKDYPSVVVTTDNPYINIVGVKSIKIDSPKDKRFGIGPQAGYGITNAFKASPYIGIGLHYSVIRF